MPKSRVRNRLHERLAALDPAAAKLIHANDVSKVVRAIEVSMAAQQPDDRDVGAGA